MINLVKDRTKTILDIVKELEDPRAQSTLHTCQTIVNLETGRLSGLSLKK